MKLIIELDVEGKVEAQNVLNKLHFRGIDVKNAKLGDKTKVTFDESKAPTEFIQTKADLKTVKDQRKVLMAEKLEKMPLDDAIKLANSMKIDISKIKNDKDAIIKAIKTIKQINDDSK